MKYICESCFFLYPSGSIGDIPGTVLPTSPSVCAKCLQLITPGIELTGHMVDDLVLKMASAPVALLVSGSVLSGSR